MALLRVTGLSGPIRGTYGYQMMGVGEDGYSMFQFEVDNASSIERSVALLLTQLHCYPAWVRHYLAITPNTNIQHTFFHQFVKSISIPPKPLELRQLHGLLQVAQCVPDRWLLKAACDTLQPEILATLLEVPGVEEHVDAWICLYAANVPSLYHLLVAKKQGNLTVPL